MGHQRRFLEGDEGQDLSAWVKSLQAIAPPEDVILRDKLMRKREEYAQRLAVMQPAGHAPPLQDQDFLHGTYKFMLLDTILKAEGTVDVSDVVAAILEKLGIEGFDPFTFTDACGVIMTYLGFPPPGTPVAGGTGL